ncbi:MAG: hypothetical protein AAF772_06595 [Acidobacteriota bacterium]
MKVDHQRDHSVERNDDGHHRHVRGDDGGHHHVHGQPRTDSIHGGDFDDDRFESAGTWSIPNGSVYPDAVTSTDVSLREEGHHDQRPFEERIYFVPSELRNDGNDLSHGAADDPSQWGDGKVGGGHHHGDGSGTHKVGDGNDKHKAGDGSGTHDVGDHSGAHNAGDDSGSFDADAFAADLMLALESGANSSTTGVSDPWSDASYNESIQTTYDEDWSQQQQDQDQKDRKDFRLRRKETEAVTEDVSTETNRKNQSDRIETEVYMESEFDTSASTEEDADVELARPEPVVQLDDLETDIETSGERVDVRSGQTTESRLTQEMPTTDASTAPAAHV